MPARKRPAARTAPTPGTKAAIEDERDNLARRLDALKSGLVDFTMGYEQGCESGRRKFLEELGEHLGEPLVESFDGEVTVTLRARYNHENAIESGLMDGTEERDEVVATLLDAIVNALDQEPVLSGHRTRDVPLFITETKVEFDG